jgi:hypothetical protein
MTADGKPIEGLDGQADHSMADGADAQTVARKVAAFDEMLKQARICLMAIDRLGFRLSADVRPGHCDYIGKDEASAWAKTIATGLRSAIRKAEGRG